MLEDKIRLLHEKYSSERPAPRERDLEMGESYRSVNTARTWGEHSARSGYNDQVVRLSARGDEGLASSRRLQESLRGSTARSGYLPLTQRSEYDDGAHVFGETHGRGKVDAAAAAASAWREQTGRVDRAVRGPTLQTRHRRLWPAALRPSACCARPFGVCCRFHPCHHGHQTPARRRSCLA